MAGGHPPVATSIRYGIFLERLSGSALLECPLMALSGHSSSEGSCPLLRGKADLSDACSNGCLSPIPYIALPRYRHPLPGPANESGAMKNSIFAALGLIGLAGAANAETSAD